MRLIDVDAITDDEIISYLGIRYASCKEDIRDMLDEQPTLDETEIICKGFERVVERLEEEAKENDYTAWQFDDDGTEYIKEKYEEIASAYREAIEIIKEECGINE